MEYLTLLFGEHPLVIVDNTGIHCWEVDSYVQAGMAAGYAVQVRSIKLNTIDQINNCADRAKAPRETVYKMACEMECWPQQSDHLQKFLGIQHVYVPYKRTDDDVLVCAACGVAEAGGG